MTNHDAQPLVTRYEAPGHYLQEAARETPEALIVRAGEAVASLSPQETYEELQHVSTHLAHAAGWLRAWRERTATPGVPPVETAKKKGRGK